MTLNNEELPEAIEFFDCIASLKFKIDLFLSDLEVLEIFGDQIGLVYRDCKKYTCPSFSNKQIDRLNNVQRLLHIKEYSDSSLRSCITRKPIYDSCSYERYIYYINKFSNRGCYADNVLKCVKLKYKGLLTYAIKLHAGEKTYILGFTSHLLHRLAERNNLDVTRTETIFEIFKVYLNNVSISVDGDNVNMFSNNGVFLGKGSAIAIDRNTTNLDEKYKLVQMNQGALSIVYFSTFITQDMMYNDQRLARDKSESLVFDSDRVPDSFVKSLYDNYYSSFRDKGMNKLFGKDKGMFSKA